MLQLSSVAKTYAGGRYFEYAMERPTWPSASLSSARYTVARGTWNGVSIEVYHDAKHPWNVATMMDAARRSLAYFSREFGPYPLSHFRIVEYPRYSGAAKAFAGTIPYSESAGFLTDLRRWASLDAHRDEVSVSAIAEALPRIARRLAFRPSTE